MLGFPPYGCRGGELGLQGRPLGAHSGCSVGRRGTQGASKLVNYKVSLHFNARFPPHMAAVGPTDANWACSGGRWGPIGAAVTAAGAPKVHQGRRPIKFRYTLMLGFPPILLLWGPLGQQWRPLGAHWGCSGGRGGTQGASRPPTYKISLHFNARFPPIWLLWGPLGLQWRPLGAIGAAVARGGTQGASRLATL